MKTADEAIAEGVNYCGPVKTIHKWFCLSTLEKSLKDWPGGSYLVMKSTLIVTGGRPLIYIGYEYNSRKVLCFIATEGAGSTEPGDPYLYNSPGIYSNVSVPPVVRPHLICRNFNVCNTIDNNKRMR